MSKRSRFQLGCYCPLRRKEDFGIDFVHLSICTETVYRNFFLCDTGWYNRHIRLFFIRLRLPYPLIWTCLQWESSELQQYAIVLTWSLLRLLSSIRWIIVIQLIKCVEHRKTSNFTRKLRHLRKIYYYITF